MNGARRVLLLMSGSIACAKATGLISAWRQRGWEVRVAATRSVRQFIGPATLEGLCGEAPFDDTFGDGRAMDHVALAQWAELLVVCPATAHLLARFAAGLADDAVTTVWQAAWGRGLPQVVVPAMNTHMWEYPATRENVTRLERWGVHVLPTAEGPLACGEQGAGRMLETDEILRRIDLLLGGAQRYRGRVLVTGGGTREPIDAVRYIGNHSTGATAAAMSDSFTDLGFDVTWLGGESAVEPGAVAGRERYRSYDDLDRALRGLLGNASYDLVVHAAAVADFTVARDDAPPGPEKLPSDSEQTLRLRPTPKLLARLRDYADNPGLRVVGFKLTAGAGAEEAARSVARQFERCGPDLVVHNDLEEIRAGRHRYTVNDASGPVAAHDDARALASGLAQHFFGEGES